MVGITKNQITGDCRFLYSYGLWGEKSWADNDWEKPYITM